MKEFHLQARRLVGPLSAPLCDDRVLAESDSRRELTTQGAALAAAGFTVWIFRRTPGGWRSASHTSRLVDRIDPTGTPRPDVATPAVAHSTGTLDAEVPVPRPR